METQLQIAFRNMERSDAIVQKITERAAKLDTSYDGIIGCRVTVELQHKHHRSGNHYQVRVDLRVPGAELVVNREPGEHHAYTDVYVALRDAFDTAQRQLDESVRRRRGEVKRHEAG